MVHLGVMVSDHFLMNPYKYFNGIPRIFPDRHCKLSLLPSDHE